MNSKRSMRDRKTIESTKNNIIKLIKSGEDQDYIDYMMMSFRRGYVPLSKKEWLSEGKVDEEILTSIEVFSRENKEMKNFSYGDIIGFVIKSDDEDSGYDYGVCPHHLTVPKANVVEFVNKYSPDRSITQKDVVKFKIFKSDSEAEQWAQSECDKLRIKRNKTMNNFCDRLCALQESVGIQPTQTAAESTTPSELNDNKVEVESTMIGDSLPPPPDIKNFSEYLTNFATVLDTKDLVEIDPTDKVIWAFNRGSMTFKTKLGQLAVLTTDDGMHGIIQIEDKYYVPKDEEKDFNKFIKSIKIPKNFSKKSIFKEDAEGAAEQLKDAIDSVLKALKAKGNASGIKHMLEELDAAVEDFKNSEGLDKYKNFSDTPAVLEEKPKDTTPTPEEANCPACGKKLILNFESLSDDEVNEIATEAQEITQYPEQYETESDQIHAFSDWLQNSRFKDFCDEAIFKAFCGLKK